MSKLDLPTRSSLDQQRTLPRADTNNEHPSTPSRSVTDPTNGKNVASPKSPRQGHKKLVFTDPVAFRYLEEDPATIVLDRRRWLEGYQIYVVEQWACSRVHPTFMIATYTGDVSHRILVSVLSVPVDESTWSKRLQIYFKAVSQFHAREMESPLGTLMITNLSSFPSALTVLAVPDGDVKKHREDFIVNENLKRLGCSGRAALNIQAPQASTIAKFHQLYRTSENVPLYASVMELVKLCQTSLIVYGKLLPDYADGLLCDITERAITEWWAESGTFFYNIEPSDGILGPTTVAALLGLLMGAYNRLKATGASVGKDVLDILSMKRAIGAFQKSQKLEKTRRLDRVTLEKLHNATVKTARNEGWTVPKAVKSTVAELGGKGGEMVMSIVGARDKAGIAEVETLDLDRMSQLVSGSKMKWLWQGKPIKSAATDSFGRPSDELNGRVFSTDEQGNFLWTSDKRGSVYDTDMMSRMARAYNEKHDEKRFGRLRDAVAGRSHQSKLSKDEGQLEDPNGTRNGSTKSQGLIKDLEEKADHLLQRAPSGPGGLSHFDITSASKRPEIALRRTTSKRTARQSEESSGLHAREQNSKDSRPKPRGHQSRVDTIRDELKSGVYRDFSSAFHYDGPRTRVLRRSRSAVVVKPLLEGNPRARRMARHLSFSLVEGSILTYQEAVDGDQAKTSDPKPSAALAAVDASAIAAQQKAKRILFIQQSAVPYAEYLVNQIENLDTDSREHLEELNTTYYQRLEDYQALRATSTELVAEEKAALAESLRRVEMLGAKLDYEINSLQSRVKEVEDSTTEFERDVVDLENRVKELTGAGELQGSGKWGNWLLSLGIHF